MRQSFAPNGLKSKKQVALGAVRQINSLRVNREQAVKFNQTEAVAR